MKHPHILRLLFALSFLFSAYTKFFGPGYFEITLMDQGIASSRELAAHLTRFFIGLENKQLLLHKTAVCYQSTSSTKINFRKKEKIISFVGKLNTAKGYDLFGKSVLKILNEFPDWKAKVIGDEPREKIDFKHKRLSISGYTKHEKVLQMLKKVSISVVCSRWEEPFGRTSLEASSRGCAVVVSNRGGLPETITNGIIIRNLSVKSVYNSINKLMCIRR